MIRNAEASEQPSQVEYRSAPLPMRFVAGNPIPNYTGLRIASVVLMICAIGAYAIGLIALLTILLQQASSFVYYFKTASGVLSIVSMLLLAMSPLAVGAVLHAMSAACAALRDIARNSLARK